MSRTRFLVVPLVGLIIVGLLILGGFAIHRIGWAEGYRMGQLAPGADGGVVPPYAGYGFGFPGFLLTLAVIFLLILVIGRVFRFMMWGLPWGPRMMHALGPEGRRWKMPGRSKGEFRAKHWHRHHGHMPPWCWDWEEGSEEAEPDAETDVAQA